jgi:hypothetical protein
MLASMVSATCDVEKGALDRLNRSVILSGGNAQLCKTAAPLNRPCLRSANACGASLIG